jgi:hypothetical protein
MAWAGSKHFRSATRSDRPFSERFHSDERLTQKAATVVWHATGQTQADICELTFTKK